MRSSLERRTRKLVARAGRRVTAAFTLLFVVWMAACSSTDERVDEGPAPRGAERAARPQVSGAFDLAGIMRHVHFAFRPDGATWTGGHSTYEVRATEDAFEVTPALADQGGGATRGAPARFTNVSLGRSSPPAVAPRRARVDVDGSLVTRAGQVAERLENREEGVEQSFAFDRAPEASSWQVTRPTKLADILEPDMGFCVWGACR